MGNSRLVKRGSSFMTGETGLQRRPRGWQWGGGQGKEKSERTRVRRVGTLMVGRENTSLSASDGSPPTVALSSCCPTGPQPDDRKVLSSVCSVQPRQQHPFLTWPATAAVVPAEPPAPFSSGRLVRGCPKIPDSRSEPAAELRDFAAPAASAASPNSSHPSAAPSFPDSRIRAETIERAADRPRARPRGANSGGARPSGSECASAVSHSTRRHVRVLLAHFSSSSSSSSHLEELK